MRALQFDITLQQLAHGGALFRGFSGDGERERTQDLDSVFLRGIEYRRSCLKGNGVEARRREFPELKVEAAAPGCFRMADREEPFPSDDEISVPGEGHFVRAVRIDVQRFGTAGDFAAFLIEQDEFQRKLRFSGRGRELEPFSLRLNIFSGGKEGPLCRFRGIDFDCAGNLPVRCGRKDSVTKCKRQIQFDFSRRFPFDDLFQSEMIEGNGGRPAHFHRKRDGLPARRHDEFDAFALRVVHTTLELFFRFAGGDFLRIDAEPVEGVRVPRARAAHIVGDAVTPGGFDRNRILAYPADDPVLPDRDMQFSCFDCSCFAELPRSRAARKIAVPQFAGGNRLQPGQPDAFKFQFSPAGELADEIGRRVRFSEGEISAEDPAGAVSVRFCDHDILPDAVRRIFNVHPAMGAGGASDPDHAFVRLHIFYGEVAEHRCSQRVHRQFSVTDSAAAGRLNSPVGSRCSAEKFPRFARLFRRGRLDRQ